MKRLLRALMRRPEPPQEDDSSVSIVFSTLFAAEGVDPTMLVPWEARANEVGARRLAPARGLGLLRTLWAHDRHMNRLDAHGVRKFERYFQFASVPADRDIIRQDEYGNFMAVLLSGSIVVDREQPWGERLRLAEARPGDVLGEMSLFDGGMRTSTCSSVTECEIAVLGADALDEMMKFDAPLAASLIALLARKLTLQLRLVSARLSDREY